MSEFVSVTYKCVGSDLNDLFKFYEAFWTNDEDRPRPHDVCKCEIDIAPIVASLGFDLEKYDLHGLVINYRLEGRTLIIDYITGYSEQKDFRKCIETRFPSIKVYYKFDNDHAPDYYTNDSSGDYFPTYYFESYVNTIYCKTIEEAATKASQITGSNVAPSAEEIYDALDKYYREHDICIEDCYRFMDYKIRDD